MEYWPIVEETKGHQVEHHRNQWIGYLIVIMASSIASGHVRTTTRKSRNMTWLVFHAPICHVIGARNTWVSNYRCPIWTNCNWIPEIGYPRDFYVNYARSNGFLANIFYSFQNLGDVFALNDIQFVISNRPSASRSSNFEITRAITPWIALHSVQLLLLIGCFYSVHLWYSTSMLWSMTPVKTRYSLTSIT